LAHLREVDLDWIEQLFGISPDAGSGTLEALIAGAIVAVALGVALSVVRARRAAATEKRS